MWEVLALTAALCQVLRNTVMKRLGHELDEYMAVWGRFTFLLPFAAFFVLWHGAPVMRNVPRPSLGIGERVGFIASSETKGSPPSSGSTLRHAHIFEMGLWFAVQQARCLTQIKQGI